MKKNEIFEFCNEYIPPTPSFPNGDEGEVVGVDPALLPNGTRGVENLDALAIEVIHQMLSQVEELEARVLKLEAKVYEKE